MIATLRTNEAIIEDALGRAADLEIGSDADGWRLSRWRQFVGSYSLPALPDPIFSVHIAGKPRVHVRERTTWSETISIPGCATILPAGQSSAWLVDGELDVVVLSIASKDIQASPAREQFQSMRFAFADPLGVALTRQVLAELYAPQTGERQAYVGALVSALKAHMLRGPLAANAAAFPTSDFAAYRIHHIMNAVLQHPEYTHSLEEMAATAGLTPPHFCRVFKRAVGVSPHQYVMKARLERAQEMLAASDLSIAAVAESLGFGSQSHFTRAFRAHAGQTPSAWRGSALA